MSKKGCFLQFCADLSRNLSLLKQFANILLKVLITLFQKILWFAGVCATVQEKLTIKLSKKMLTQQKFDIILQLQALISLR